MIKSPDATRRNARVLNEKPPLVGGDFSLELGRVSRREKRQNLPSGKLTGLA
jgi:hypothetical protein